MDSQHQIFGQDTTQSPVTVALFVYNRLQTSSDAGFIEE